jgi:hypothetical protein
MAEQNVEQTSVKGEEAADLEWLQQFQVQHREWRLRNFGEPKSHQPLLGMIEELGELEDGKEQREAELGDVLIAEEVDAIGDILVYAVDLCGSRTWSMAVLWSQRTQSLTRPMISSMAPGYKTWPQYMRKLAHHQLKGEQNIRGGLDHHEEQLRIVLREIFGALEAYYRNHAGAAGGQVLSVVRAVWAKVQQRDWVNNPNTAHEVADAAGE